MTRTQHDMSLSDDVYSQLKDYILSDVIHPSERLQIGQLSHHFGVSITPIREALIRLASELLIDFKPGRGFFYRDFIPAEQLQFCELKFAVLKFAIEKGSQRHSFRVRYDPEQLEVHEDNDWSPSEKSMYSYVQAIETLYVQIALASGNTQMASLVQSLCERTRVSRILDLEQPGNAKIVLEGSRKVVEALQRNDPQAAVQMLRQQLDDKRERMHILANERLRRVYQAYPLRRPGYLRR